MLLSDIKKNLIYDFKSEPELVKSIEKISENFTSKRENLGQYVEDPKMVAAYSAFYLSTNYPKFSLILENQFSDRKNIFENSQIIDIGSGPGSILFGMVDTLEGKGNEYWAVESSRLMREQANKFAVNLYPNKIQGILSPNEIRKIPKGINKRVLVFTHSFNEMGESAALDYIEKLKPEYVVLIEPGTMPVFQEFIGLRSRMLRQGFNCLYPCLGNQKCPMNSEKDWCHQYIKVSHDLDVQRLTQIAKLNRQWAAMTLSIFSKRKDELKSFQKARIVRTFPSTKFSFEWEVCLTEKEDFKIVHFQILKRKLSKKNIKSLEEILAGALMSYDVIKKMSENEYRVEIKDIDEFI